MRSREHIERVLSYNLDEARSAYENARKQFGIVIDDIPSRLPQPDGQLRIRNAARDEAVAREAYVTALRALNGFHIRRTGPERLKKDVRRREPESGWHSRCGTDCAPQQSIFW